MPPRSERLLQPNEEVPGPELAAVGMARELKVKAQSDGRLRTARLVPRRHARLAFVGVSDLFQICASIICFLLPSCCIGERDQS